LRIALPDPLAVVTWSSSWKKKLSSLGRLPPPDAAYALRLLLLQLLLKASATGADFLRLQTKVMVKTLPFFWTVGGGELSCPDVTFAELAT